jgi:hypothetical protein
MPIPRAMRSVIGICVTMGTFVGGWLPSVWGDSGFSLVSLVAAALGGLAGLWCGLRLQA